MLLKTLTPHHFRIFLISFRILIHGPISQYPISKNIDFLIKNLIDLFDFPIDDGIYLRT